MRLLGLDPFEVHAARWRARARLDELAAEAAGSRRLGPSTSFRPPRSLLADILAEHHATWEVRLFAS